MPKVQGSRYLLYIDESGDIYMKNMSQQKTGKSANDLIDIKQLIL